MTMTTTRDLGSLLDRNRPVDLLGDRASRALCNNTSLQRRGEDVALVLHATDVATFHPDGSITLDSGGYETVTTRQRMNAALQGTRYRVFQRDWTWYVEDTMDGRTHAYRDGITVVPGGEVR